MAEVGVIVLYVILGCIFGPLVAFLLWAAFYVDKHGMPDEYWDL